MGRDRRYSGAGGEAASTSRTDANNLRHRQLREKRTTPCGCPWMALFLSGPNGMSELSPFPRTPIPAEVRILSRLSSWSRFPFLLITEPRIARIKIGFCRQEVFAEGSGTKD